MRAAVLTCSDRCARGEAADTSGPHIVGRLREAGFEIVELLVVPDDAAAIAAALRRWADELGVDVVVTTGGTGFSPRDVTPEATLSVVERRAPGIAELVRAEGLKKTPHACLSRGEAGLRGNTLIVNLPGSLKAVRDGMDALVTVLPHAVRMIAGGDHIRER
ncbi:MAG TPA: MogA/MoaB family molybdenum cofactor biosynthesis protein [Thermoanaerobaculaceae bacterium]|nr:MogA/MoaB family molybdenum cofactor biosynthesis protein [Thermoanaerobaculaceae bacterium]HRS16496.1 MogA/MoaB family molybdenum cofactor biosynthesis protein [Thermoanaerobaculaceae bacterium]